jgi:precorrin-3B synthase
MQTGDGLLARLRPAGGVFTLHQFRQLADAARRHGNGLIEITARGSVQIRGLAANTVDLMTTEIRAAGIVVHEGPAIELPPLHGLLADEIDHPAMMEEFVRTQLGERLRSAALAPKLSIVIDGGGAFGLGSISADIRLVATSPGKWAVAIGGDGRSARTIALGTRDQVIHVAGEVLDLLVSMGWQRRGRDIGSEWSPSLPGLDEFEPPGLSRRGETTPIGLHQARDGTSALGLRPRFGQIQGSDIVGFLDAVEAVGVREIRTAPGRCFFLTGMTEQGASRVREIALRHGLSADQHEPSDHVAVCAGAGACSSGFYATRTLAMALVARHPELLDGTSNVHFSGCSKGCAHSGPALTIAGVAQGYNLILDGRASDAPDAQIAGGDIDSAIEKLAQLIKSEGDAGESAAACLRRLGRDNVTRALRQG